MDLKNRFETDKLLEEEGVWVDIGDGGRLKVARRGNRRYRDKLRALTRGRERQLQLNTLPEDIAEDMLCQALACGILLDWDGIEEDGRKLAYAQETAVELLRRYADFRVLVETLSDDMAAYRTRELEAAEKN